MDIKALIGQYIEEIRNANIENFKDKAAEVSSSVCVSSAVRV